MNAATTNILSPDILPVEELGTMLRHTEVQLPPIMHLPISMDDTIHFYQYPKTHVLVADGQFLLLIDILIQDRAQQLQILPKVTPSLQCYIQIFPSTPTL